MMHERAIANCMAHHCWPLHLSSLGTAKDHTDATTMLVMLGMGAGSIIVVAKCEYLLCREAVCLLTRYLNQPQQS